MEYLSICFQEQCRSDNRQILYVRNPDSKSHYHEFHAVEAVHPDTPFIRSFETKPIRFQENLYKIHSQLQGQYEIIVERVKSALKTGLQQCEQRIRNIYELNGEEIALKLFEPHLREKTPQTELWLTLMNWKKDHPTEDIKKYIQDLPEILINEYRVTTNNIVDALISNLPESPNNLCKKSNQTNTKQQEADLKGGSKLIMEIGRQISDIYKGSIKPKEIPKFSELPSVKKERYSRKETLMQLAEVFCNSKQELKYKNLDWSLRDKIRSSDTYKSYLISIFRKVYNGINGEISNNLRKRRITYDPDCITTDLKNYRIWMQSNEADIFIRCVRFFMGLDRRIVINVCEIYIIYVPIIIRMIEKTVKNNILPCDSPAQRLERDVMYLYSHFSNFHTVTQLVTRQYHSTSVKQSMKVVWRKIVVDSYTLIKEKQHVQNVAFFQLVFQEQEFCHQQCWGGIMRQYIKYRLRGRMNKSERQSLEQSMMIVVRNGRALQHFTNEDADPSFKNDAENETEFLASSAVSSVQTKIEQKDQSLQYPSTAKREQLQSLKVNDYEIKVQEQQVRSILPH